MRDLDRRPTLHLMTEEAHDALDNASQASAREGWSLRVEQIDLWARCPKAKAQAPSLRNVPSMGTNALEQERGF